MREPMSESMKESLRQEMKLSRERWHQRLLWRSEHKTSPEAGKLLSQIQAAWKAYEIVVRPSWQHEELDEHEGFARRQTAYNTYIAIRTPIEERLRELGYDLIFQYAKGKFHIEPIIPDKLD